MATVQALVTRALRRIGVVDALQSPSSEDSAAGLAALNEMIDGWAGEAVDVKHRQVFTSGFVLSDTFWMFIPPSGCSWSTVYTMTYGGTWNASTNSPTLADGTGTLGTFYRVATAGGTDLDDVTGAWVVDDSLILGRLDNTSDDVWLKGRHPVGYEGAVVAMLALRLTDEYGITPQPMLVADASSGWGRIAAAYVIPAPATYDAAVVSTPNRFRNWY